MSVLFLFPGFANQNQTKPKSFLETDFNVFVIYFFRISTSLFTAQSPTTSTCTAAKTRNTSTQCPSTRSITKRQMELSENSSKNKQRTISFFVSIPTFHYIFLSIFFLFVSSNNFLSVLFQVNFFLI
jgi:hypothetical protein